MIDLPVTCTKWTMDQTTVPLVPVSLSRSTNPHQSHDDCSRKRIGRISDEPWPANCHHYLADRKRMTLSRSQAPHRYSPRSDPEICPAGTPIALRQAVVDSRIDPATERGQPASKPGKSRAMVGELRLRTAAIGQAGTPALPRPD